MGQGRCIRPFSSQCVTRVSLSHWPRRHGILPGLFIGRCAASCVWRTARSAAPLTTALSRSLRRTSTPRKARFRTVTRVASVAGHSSSSFQLPRPAGNGLLVSDGEVWQRQRRLSNPAFRRAAVEAYAGAMTGATRDMLEGAWRQGECAEGLYGFASHIVNECRSPLHVCVCALAAAPVCRRHSGRIRRLQRADAAGGPTAIEVETMSCGRCEQ